MLMCVQVKTCAATLQASHSQSHSEFIYESVLCACGCVEPCEWINTEREFSLRTAPCPLRTARSNL